MPQSFDRPRNSDIAPSAWVLRFAHLVRPGGTVLDLACGSGRHARWFAARGCRVVAADIDVTGLADLRENPSVEILETDLEAADWPLAGRCFDAVVVTNYLHRPNFPRLPALLEANGVLIFETFGAGNEALGRPRNPAFLLAPGELLDALGAQLQVVAYEHGTESLPRPAVRQRLCAVKVDAGSESGPAPIL
jgi:SAM-dependent methyltransferase